MKGQTKTNRKVCFLKSMPAVKKESNYVFYLYWNSRFLQNIEQNLFGFARFVAR